MNIIDIIEKKRDGMELSYDELKYFIDGLCNGEIADYQASALLMAFFIRGLNSRETVDLTANMAASGDMADLSEIPGIKVDKHSTGGVGDKTTIVVGPIIAACGVPVAKMSGRGLGHTGGTIDKLESIKGMRTSLSREEFINNVKQIGIAIAGQTGNLAPADKKLYALRDVTATVDNIPLIASSIMSKKLASGADRILLDVKTGSGAFMKSLDDSIKLAREMVSIGAKMKRKTVAVITDMDMPLGNAVGNALEVKEAVMTLQGNGPKDLETVCIELAARMLELARLGTVDECRSLSEKKIRDGSAFKKLEELAAKQGALYSLLDSRALETAPIVEKIPSPFEGYISSVQAELIGKASMHLGAGRKTKESVIDHSAGIVLFKKPGDMVKKGEMLAEFHTSSKQAVRDAEEMFMKAYKIADNKPVSRPMILAYVDESNTIRFDAH
jgi:pyrimidine-nucleoside phosphorylase